MKLLKKLLGKPPDEFKEEVAKATEHARSVFHKRYGDAYGPPGSTFMDREKNTRRLLRSTFPRGKRLTATGLDLRGFDGNPETSDDAATAFLDAFYHELDQTNSRALARELALQNATRERSEILEGVDRQNRSISRIDDKIDGLDQKLNAALEEKTFPNAIRAAIAQPSLIELSDLMKARQAQEALAYAKRRLEAIDVALQETDDPDERYAEALRTHRQRLLFASATAASWLGDKEAGRAFWRRACDLGRIDPEWYKQAAVTLFNIGLKDELRHLVDKMEKGSDEYRSVAPLLAYLEEKWSRVDELLVDAKSADQILLRVHALLQIIDPEDSGAVESTAMLLDQTDTDNILPIVNLDRARLTVELLQLVVTGYTPLEYDRRLLVDNQVRRIYLALESTEPDTLFRAHALQCLGVAAELLRDVQLTELCTNGVEALEENIRSSVFFQRDPELTPEKIDFLLDDGKVNVAQAAILKAGLYQASQQLEELERELRRALFATQDQRQAAYVLRLLTQHLRRANRTDEVKSLIEATPLRPADNWLVRADNLPVGKTPLDIAHEVEAFELDVNVIELLARSTLSTVKVTSPEDAAPEPANLERAEAAVCWTTRLVQVLPSRSSRLLHAHALNAARRYGDLLSASRDLDPEYAEQAIELEAGALVGLGRRAEAAHVLIKGYKEHPETQRFAVSAAALLLADDKPEKAANLLESLVTSDTSDPDVLFGYALAIRAQDPSSRDQASKAFDLLDRAYALCPKSHIAEEAWKAARAAQRWADARRYFMALMADSPVKVVQSEDDFHEALRAASENRFVQIEGGFEYLAELKRKEGERADNIDLFFSAHALAYVDLFRFAGRPWERWAAATQQFERRSSEGVISNGEFSVLADWPGAHPEYGRRHKADDFKMFADKTAILTLGVLGPDMAKQVLSALGTCFVEAGTLKELSRHSRRIQGKLLSSDSQRYVEATRFLRRIPDGIVSYSEDVASAALQDPNLGPCRVDLGVAVLNDALYVTDLDNSQDWSETANQLRISSVALLASLNAAGMVSVDRARDAAKMHPNVFDGWNRVSPLSVPDFLVFDEFSFLDWLEAGLADSLGNRIKVGPWAWKRISDEAAQREAAELAYDRLRGTNDVLQRALEKNIVVELEAIADGSTHDDANEDPDGSPSPIETMWSEALKSLRTAQTRGLQLWADDRFYPLLLRLGGPTQMGPELHAIRDPFVDWSKDSPPISTMELLSQLSSSERLTPNVAQDAASKLFAHGYRTAHPILLVHAFRQFPAPVTTPLTPPFQRLVSAIKEIPRYLPEEFDDYYRNRDGIVRLASMSVAEQFIVGVWKAEGLSNDQRCAMANAFLEAVEHVFKEASPQEFGAGSDRTPIILWQSLALAIQTMPIHNYHHLELRQAALCWLGNSAVSRTEQSKHIVRVLEDNVLMALMHAQKALEESGEANRLSQVVVRLVVPSLVPLTDTDLINALDPLMRRTVCTLARLPRDGRIDENYYTTAIKDDTPLTVSEEDKEQAASEVLKRAVTGDPVCARSIRATDLEFLYTHPAPTEWIDAGYPDDEHVPIDVRCSLFTLLWADPPGLRKLIVQLIVYHVSALDAALAYRILLVEDSLLSDDPDVARQARDRLAFDVLRSGFFDLQRDLVHAVRRFRHYDADDFAHFIGWVGEEAAQALASQPLTAPVQKIGPLLVPIAHSLGRAMLTHEFDDVTHILKRAKQLVEAGDDPNDAAADWRTLPEWLADKASVAENADDPFGAAWALRSVLLVLSAVKQDPEMNINGRATKVSDWAKDYLETALAANVGQLSELAQRMENRRRLSSAALRLAAFACSGRKHLQACSQFDNPQAKWLDQVWLLATKLQFALIGLRGSVASGAASATAAVQELELDTPDILVLDAFDPYVFGPNGEDIGIALTLTAMLKVILQFPDANEHPIWWTDAIRSLVNELENASPKEASKSDERIDNCFGLVAPLRIRILAQQLTVALTS